MQSQGKCGKQASGRRNGRRIRTSRANPPWQTLSFIPNPPDLNTASDKSQVNRDNFDTFNLPWLHLETISPNLLFKSHITPFDATSARNIFQEFYKLPSLF